MTAQTVAQREDAQSRLLDPGTPTPAESAWAHLLDEAERNVRRTGDAELHAAVVGVREVRRG